MSARVWLVAACLLSTAYADRDKARQFFEAGAKSYNLGEYQKALDEFRRAYLEHPEPILLYNLGQCWRQLGDKLKAVGFYRAYLRERPNAENAAEVRGLVLRLDGEILVDEQTREAAPSGAAAPPATAEPPRPVPEPAPAPWFRNTAGWAVAGGGVAAALLGAGLTGGALEVNGQARGASSLGEQEHLHTRAQQLEVSGWVFVGAGVAAAIAGVVMLAVRAPRPRRVP